MEKGELVVTTETPETLRTIKISALLGCIVIAAFTVWSTLTAENGTIQTMTASVVVCVALVVIGILNYIRPESCCNAYEHVVEGLAVRGSGSRTDPFTLRYEEITELRTFKKRSLANNLLICTEQAEYNVFCRANRSELIAYLSSRITPEEETEEA